MGAILLDNDGDFPKHPTITDRLDPRLIAQRVQFAVSLFREEWMLNQNTGVPWLRWLQETPPPLVEMENFLATEMDQVPGVAAVLSIDSSFVDEVITIEARLQTVKQNEFGLDFELRQSTENHPITSTNAYLLP